MLDKNDLEQIRMIVRETEINLGSRIDKVQGELRDFRIEVSQNFKEVRAEVDDFRVEVNERFDRLTTMESEDVQAVATDVKKLGRRVTRLEQAS